MTTPDLLTLIRRACEGTPAEGLAPMSGVHGPLSCSLTCPLIDPQGRCRVPTSGIYETVCIPAIEALARLALSQDAEVNRLTEALRVATANPSMPSNGCEPGPGEKVELVWVPWGSGWSLCLPSRPHPGMAPYDAYADGYAMSFNAYGAKATRNLHCGTTPAACRWIADRARADGYRVPAHPLEWDVGGAE